jgi:hypothetical protein
MEDPGMKGMTTLAAAAALIAGIAVASAQTSTSKSNTMKGAMTGNAAWCLQDESTATNCKFASRDECQKEAKTQGQCIQNPKMGTTGSGAMGASGSMSKEKK